MKQEVDALVNAHPQFRLAQFEDILTEMLAHWGSLDGLRGIDVLELGPNTRVEMMRFLETSAGVKSIRGVGQTVLWPWIPHQAFIRDHVESCRFLQFFERDTPSRFDLIYSRHVMEQHSIHPWVLLTSAAYWAQLKKKACADFDESYPSSVPNIQATFKAAWNALRPGGLIISQIGKRKYGCLDEAFLATLDPQPSAVHRRDIGSLSSMVTATK
ncbi:MAG: hypothetical protein IH892_17635 [Planctomycetes bacterium]|nr:hypothetical protein [Planctomycetota bacterium]